MNKISDRRKGRNTISNRNNEEDAMLIRMTTNVSMINTAPPSFQEFRKIIKDLQETAQRQKQKRMEIQENLKHYQQRAMAREKQFYSIIQESNKSVRSYLKQESKGTPPNEIKKVYDQIFKNFEGTNEATNALIQRKYRQNLQTMERKIQNIMEAYTEQISKNKRMSTETFQQIKQQIQKALTMVKQVENENVSLRINLKQQQQRNRLMAQERKLLIEQMVNKKLLMNKLVQQNRKFKNKIQQYRAAEKSKQDTDYRASRAVSKYSQNLNKQEIKEIPSGKKFKTLSSTMNNIEQSKKNYLGSQLNIQNNTRQQTAQNSRKPTQSRVSSVSVSRSQERVSTKNIKALFKSNLTSNNSNLSAHKNQIKFMNQSKKYVSKKQFFQRSFDFNEDDKSLCILIQEKNGNNIKNEQMQIGNGLIQNSNQKTIQHLKSCLQREKKKVAQFGRLFTKIQNRNQQVNEAIMQALSTSQSRSYSSEGRDIQNLLKSEKLLQIIIDMKKRLAMFQKPTLNCGWGSLDLQQFIQDIQEKKDSFGISHDK